MNYKITCFFVLIILLVARISVCAEKIISVATLNDYSPYCFAKSDDPLNVGSEIIPLGKDSQILQGYSWDILRASLQNRGYTISLFIYPWSRALAVVKNGDCDVLFPTGWNKERARYFYYSKEYINRSDFLVYVRTDFKRKWQGLESLNGLRIGHLIGWNYGEKFKSNKGIHKVKIRSIIQGFKMLDKGRIDGIAGYEVNFDQALKSTDWRHSYKKLPVFDYSMEYLAGSKSKPGILFLLRDFDQGKQNIINNGQFELIEKKWKQ